MGGDNTFPVNEKREINFVEEIDLPLGEKVGMELLSVGAAVDQAAVGTGRTQSAIEMSRFASGGTSNPARS